MRALRALMLGLGLALCPGVHAESAVYGLDHTIRAPGHAGTMRTLGFNRLALDTAPTGEQRLHTRPLWSQLRGGGQWRSTDDLDPDDAVDAALYAQRAVVTKKLKPVPVEAIARGYLIGSGWKDYQRTGRVSGIALPGGLRQAEQLPQPIFTPSTKAAVGDHDENIDFDTMVHSIGADLAEQVRDATLRLYAFAAAHAAERGIILADTKFEFGTDADGRLYVMDEMLTPDSSRYWPADEYEVGSSPPSYDKQIVRDYLETLDWDKTAPGPKLPAEVIERTRGRYADALQKLAGISVD